jgi:hypothetical protein
MGADGYLKTTPGTTKTIYQVLFSLVVMYKIKFTVKLHSCRNRLYGRWMQSVILADIGVVEEE